jgi:hypothetical protein
MERRVDPRELMPEHIGMSVFPNWEQFSVVQKRPLTGCIATGYEMVLRAAGVDGIEFKTFQDDFDLDKNGGAPQNNFTSVGNAVNAKYPHVKFERKEFAGGEGDKKIVFIESRLKQREPLLISVAAKPLGLSSDGWHTMPVVDMDDTTLTLLLVKHADGKNETIKIEKKRLIEIHNNFPGGNDVAYLTKIEAPK